MPWWAWPFIAVGALASGVLLFVVGVFSLLVDPSTTTGGHLARLIAFALVGAVVLTVMGNYVWAGVILAAVVAASVILVKRYGRELFEDDEPPTPGEGSTE